MFERFTPEARTVVVLAHEEARMRQDGTIGTQHLLIGLAGTGEDAASRALRAAGLDAPTLRGHLTGPAGPALDGAAPAGLESVGRATVERFETDALDSPPDPRWSKGHLPFSRGAKKSLELALRSAIGLRSGEISTGHVLLGVIDEGRDRGAALLQDCNVDVTALRADLVELLRTSAA